MEVSVGSRDKESFYGGENNNNHSGKESSLKTTEFILDETENDAEKKDVERNIQSESQSFLHRTWRKIQRNASSRSYDMECASIPSSSREECFSEADEKLDGVDSGIASEVGDGPLSSRLSSCTNYTNSSLGERVPGLSGIHNLGNTCYMNSVLQCLAHIDTVVEYFALGKYRLDLKHRKTIFRNRKIENIGKGKLTEQFAELLKSLWTFEYSKELCQDFKDAVSKHGEQYRGTSQQDAQEFLLWLLDFLHEDLGRGRGWSLSSKASIKKKKKHCTEEEQAARTLATHSHQNKSFIKNMFQAQYKSSVICPSCDTCSSTFDPFLCMSLPIPQKDTKPMYLTVLCKTFNDKPVKIGVSVSHSGTVRDLRSIISQTINVAENRLILLMAYDDGDHCSLHDENLIDSIPELDDCLFALEVPADNDVRYLPASKPTCTVDASSVDASKLNDAKNLNEAKSHVDGLAANFTKRFKSNVKEETRTIVVVVTNVELKERRTRRFGFPITMRISRDASFKELQILIRREMPIAVRNAINEEARNWKLVLGIRVIGGLVNNEFLKETETYPLRSSTVERGIVTNLSAGPVHISLVAEWEPECFEWCLAQFGFGHATEDASVKRLEEEFYKGQKVTLNDCLELHTKEEKLLYDESWKCPNCKKETIETKKKLALWSLPDVLVFHFKRFQQANQWKGKISAEIEFPISRLDMKQHLAHRSKISPEVAKKYNNSKRHLYTPPPENEDCLYDLFAVCNHIGPYMTSGHYMAVCKNSANGAWYCFDDENVCEVAEEQVCTRSAYLVFYKRRNTLTRSELTHTLSSINRHWSQLISQAQLDTVSDICS